MRYVHLVVAAGAIAISVVATLWGAWAWYRVRPSPRFWTVVRTMQVAVVVQAALGGLLVAIGNKVTSLHLIYGLLPILVSFMGELLRINSAQTVLDQRGLASAQEVGELPEDEQHEIVAVIVRRELGAITLAALIIVVLLARAAATAP